MKSVRRSTVRHAAIGAVVGVALGYIPLVLLVAPLIGGFVAGYLERADARGGALAGALAGLLMAVFGGLVTAVILAVRFGDLPFAFGGRPFAGLAVAAALSVVAAAGQVVIAAIGGALGGILEASNSRTPSESTDGNEDRGRRRSVGAAVAGLLGGLVTFTVVTVAVTAVLDSIVWPSLLVGLPVGVVAGVAVAVLGYAFLTRGPGRRAYWRTVGLGALGVVLVFGLLLGGLSMLGEERAEESYDSTFVYDVSIESNGSLDSPTVYVPAPVANDSTDLADAFVANAHYERYGPSFHAGGTDPEPVTFATDVVETEHGPMVAISADEIEVSEYYYRVVENETMGWRESITADEYDPDDPSMGSYHDGSFTFTVTLVADEPIDTAAPFGDEPLLSPRYDRTQVDCYDQYFDTQRCFSYDSRAYLDYDAAENTSVTVFASLNGYNEWFSGGWSGNEYNDRVWVQLRGPQSGWHAMTGELEVGSGNYRR